MIKKLKTDFTFEDGRGTLVQLVHEGYRQINVVTSKAGALRGGHYHAENTEVFYVVSGCLTIDAELDGKTERLSFSAGEMFAVQPGTVHSIFYPVDTVLVVMYDRGVELPGGGKDILTR